MMETNSGLMTSLKMSALNGNGQEQERPPELGDVHLLNTRAGWELYVKGALKCAGLTTRQVTELIRGELELSALVNQQTGEKENDQDA